MICTKIRHIQKQKGMMPPPISGKMKRQREEETLTTLEQREQELEDQTNLEQREEDLEDLQQISGREAPDMEMEWVVLEHELDELKLQNCEKGQWDIRLHFSCIDCR